MSLPITTTHGMRRTRVRSRRIRAQDIASFRREVYAHYHRHGRTLPWRSRPTPYRVFVSEVMLQQTQVDRVVPKFTSFVARFPSFAALAQAPQRDVMAQWQGLGYNRRAVLLHRAAQRIMRDYRGVLPRREEELASLPGIGKATAASIAAFAFNTPSVFIETNIRSAFIHYFFSRRRSVSDGELLPLVAQAGDVKNPRRWYSALMDFGVHLKRTNANPSRRSAHHTTQGKFEGSTRQLRGRIVRTLIAGPTSEKALAKRVGAPRERVRACTASLARDGIVRVRGSSVRLA